MSFSISRRALAGAGVALASGVLRPGRARATEPEREVSAIQDFDELWRTLGERYCYFEEKTTDWAKVREIYRPLAARATTLDEFSALVGRVLDELYDAHTHLSDPPAGSPRWPIFDILAERADGLVRVAAVRDASAALNAGVRIGDVITTLDGLPTEEQVRLRAPRCLTRPDPLADAYAINAAIAGRKGAPRRLGLLAGDGRAREVDLPLQAWAATADVQSRRLEDGLGYIEIRSFSDQAAVAAFDRALLDLRDTRGLIIDVRDNGGGDTGVARPIMGRFITETRPYARMRRRDGAGLGAPWTETVDPRGPFTYDKPVVVLTGRWSGSMAEGFPMGMRALGRAVLVGTPMMGLGAAVYGLRLDRTGVAAQYSGEPVYDPQDRPRWLMRPDVEVRDGDDVLAVGVATLKRRLNG
jgi:carboxyl-terminal processing protease